MTTLTDLRGDLSLWTEIEHNAAEIERSTRCPRSRAYWGRLRGRAAGMRKALTFAVWEESERARTTYTLTLGDVVTFGEGSSMVTCRNATMVTDDNLVIRVGAERRRSGAVEYRLRVSGGSWSGIRPERLWDALRHLLGAPSIPIATAERIADDVRAALGLEIER